MEFKFLPSIHRYFQKFSSNMESLKKLAKMVVIKHGLGRREDLPIDIQIDLQGMEETRQVDSYSFQKVGSNMKSLQQLAKLTLLKHGLGDEACIPVTVREELRCMEEAIRADMTGWGYHKYSRGEMSLEFDISWSRGCWSFLLRRGTENGWTEMSAEITAKSQSTLQPELADLFGFDYMRARLHGLRFTDFKLDMEERRVTFAGYYGSPQDDVPLNQFSTELWFTCSSHYVKIKTVEWDHGACSDSVTERLYSTLLREFDY